MEGTEVITADAMDSLQFSYGVPTRTLNEVSAIAQRTGNALSRQTKAGETARALITCTIIKGVYELVKMANSETFYYRHRKYNPDAPQEAIVMTQINREQLDDIVKTWHKRVFPGFFESSELKRACNTVYENIEEKIMDTKSDYTIVSDSLCYDSATGKLLQREELLDPESNQIPRVYRRMFDSDRVSGDQVLVPALDERQSNILLEEYNLTLEELDAGRFKQHIPEISQWACGEEDVYRDIIYMYATAFMKTKPLGVFFPVGVGRNGKSSCMDLWASLVGTRNVARVPLDKLGEKHFVTSLQRAMINIPDETNESYIKDQAAFRMVAAHATYQVERMASNEPVTLHCDFMMACPSNHIPKWSGDSAEACVKRTKAIPFNADFSASDLKAISWGQEHFTPDFMARLAGHVLAYASFFSQNEWEETATMIMERQGIEEDTASQFVYARLWSAIFCGYEDFELVKKDYSNWCKQKGVQEEEIKRTDVFWRRYKRSRAKNPRNGREAHVYKRNDGPNKIIMFSDLRLSNKAKTFMDGRRLCDYVELGSLVYDLEEEGILKTDADKKLIQMKMGF